MDISSKINSIEGNNKKIDEKINLANISKDNNKVKEALKEGKHLLGNNNLLIKEVEALLDNLDSYSKKEFLFTFKSAKDNNHIKQNKIDKLYKKIEDIDNYEALKSGNNNLTSKQANNALKTAAININLKGEQEKDLIYSIGNNLYVANDNLNVIAVDVDKQGLQIDKISDDVGDTNKIINRTDKRISSMNRRIWCHKFLLNIMIVVLFIANIVILVLKLANK